MRVTVTATQGSATATNSAERTFTVSVYRPTIAIAANPATIDHAGTTALTATVVNLGSALTYQWSSDLGGTFSDDDALTTNWTAPSSITLATVVELTLRATDAQTAWSPP